MSNREEMMLRWLVAAVGLECLRVGGAAAGGSATGYAFQNRVRLGFDDLGIWALIFRALVI